MCGIDELGTNYPPVRTEIHVLHFALCLLSIDVV